LRKSSANFVLLTSNSCEYHSIKVSQAIGGQFFYVEISFYSKIVAYTATNIHIFLKYF